ncbi:PREDICTED: uncharacterized protein LOC104753457 [Camelina sativa]|uniref:Uncharacterized protein LOC104753457 n=1 Tax=Camelina sativa TaxID=90675 RepID=A0ABM0WP66_CAMSA|nr:PREDICTED: uncharacterized protein LOC104753457 [Camelina sativa]
MSILMRADFNNQIKYDPEPEDAGTIRVNARIFGKDYLTFTTLSFVNEFINDDGNEYCQSRLDLNKFMKEAGISDYDIAHTMYHFIADVAEITCSTNNSSSPGWAFEVWLNLLLLPDETYIEEADQISLEYEIKHDPAPEDAGTIRVTPRIFLEEGGEVSTFPTYKFKFINDDHNESQSQVDLNDFLMETGLNDHYIALAMYEILYVAEITCSASNGYSHGCAVELALNVCILDEPRINEEVVQTEEELQIEEVVQTEEEVQIEEAVQVSLDENNIQLVAASKLVVNSLARKMYDKVSSTGKTCAICFEEFEDERSVVVILPCGHVFDDECPVKWFEINHVCPLCRFELPCEDQ